MTVFIARQAIENAEQYFERAPQVSKAAARMALNKVVGGTGRTRVKKGIEAQVAFPAGYIDDRRLHMGSKATDENLRASLVGRQRPTSLARFDPNRAAGKRGATVIVNPGQPRQIDRAFFVNLRAGDSELGNLGLAIRLKPGERVTGRRQQFSGDSTLALLYGPSVDQVMLDVAAEESPVILEDVETEFFRNFTRLME